MIEFFNKNQHVIGAYLSILFLNTVIFTVSEQTDGVFSKYINKGKLQKYLAYTSIFFSIPIVITLYNLIRKIKND